MEATLPMIMTPSYLAWLMDSCRIAGVRFRWRRVESLDLLVQGAYDTEPPEAVVVCGGIRGGELLGGDDEVFPVRGQVILVANGTGEGGSPVLTDWYIDDDDPDAQTYVLPRVDEIVVGGVAEVGAWDGEPDATTAADIYARAVAAVPELGELPVLGHGVGLRPGRSTLRLGLVDPRSLPESAAAIVVSVVSVALSVCVMSSYSKSSSLGCRKERESVISPSASSGISACALDGRLGFSVGASRVMRVVL